MTSKECYENSIYSRGGLDQLVYENFINQKLNDGIVFEIGGHDGGWLSVSRFFEKQLNFKAILVEPIKSLYELSKQNRPNAIHYNYAVNIEKCRMNEKGCIADKSYESLEDAQIDYGKAKQILREIGE